MFERLRKKWKVSGLQLFLILCTFAIGGSLTGYIGKRIMNLLNLEKGVAWVVVYIILVTLLWPMAVLVVSIFFGQFRFFINYLRKMGRRMGIVRNPGQSADSPNFKIPNSFDGVPGSKKVKVAIFASGAGSNAAKIIQHFQQSTQVRISLIVCNKPGAGVIHIAEKANIPVLLIEKEKFFRGDAYLPELSAHGIDFVVLAGFLWKVPVELIRSFPGRIVNIHPALLPDFGGKGMYGHHVHAAVIAAGKKESGITIHYVDEHYDHGDIIFQAKCPVYANDTPLDLAERVHELEHRYYPQIVEQLLS